MNTLCNWLDVLTETQERMSGRKQKHAWCHHGEMEGGKGVGRLERIWLKMNKKTREGGGGGGGGQEHIWLKMNKKTSQC